MSTVERAMMRAAVDKQEEIMTTFQRTVYEAAPAVIEMPPELQQRRVEVIIIALDDSGANGHATGEGKPGEQPVRDAFGWPAGFFEATAGKWQGAPLVREQPTEYDVREELE